MDILGSFQHLGEDCDYERVPSVGCSGNFTYCDGSHCRCRETHYEDQPNCRGYSCKKMCYRRLKYREKCNYFRNWRGKGRCMMGLDCRQVHYKSGDIIEECRCEAGYGPRDDGRCHYGVQEPGIDDFKASSNFSSFSPIPVLIILAIALCGGCAKKSSRRESQNGTTPVGNLLDVPYRIRTQSSQIQTSQNIPTAPQHQDPTPSSSQHEVINETSSFIPFSDSPSENPSSTFDDPPPSYEEAMKNLQK